MKPTKWKEVFTNNISDKVQIFTICEESLELNHNINYKNPKHPDSKTKTETKQKD